MQPDTRVFIFNNLAIVGTSIAFTILGAEKLYFWLIAPGAVLFGISLFNYVRVPSKDGLFALLRVAYDILEPPPEHSVRCTLMVPCLMRKGLLKQIRRFDPVKKHKTSRTKLKVEQGIAGRCFRMGKAHLQVVPEDVKSLAKYLVDSWGFTLEQAEQFQQDRVLYIVVPIHVPDESADILGVMCIDSDSRDTIDPDDTEKFDRVLKLAPRFAQLLSTGR